MATKDTLARFQMYSESLIATCKRNPKIIGLVLVGSTAETKRVDEWSDHDFFVITEPNQQEPLRRDLTWLPNSEEIAFSFRETEHGLKVVYDSGHVLEFAVFDCDELRGCTVNHHRLAYGEGEVERALSSAANRLPEVVVGDDLADFRHFLSVLVIQVGRARRGELITAGQGISGTAVTALLRVLTRALPHDKQLDKLDVSRRFEFAHPEVGKAIAEALAQQPEQAAIDLLNVADRYLTPIWSDYPKREVQTVKEALSWTA